MKEISTYYLIIELMNNGDAGLMPEIEPLPEYEVIEELSKRSGMSFGRNKASWLDWFISDKSKGTDQQRANMMNFREIQKIHKSISDLATKISS